MRCYLKILLLYLRSLVNYRNNNGSVATALCSRAKESSLCDEEKGAAFSALQEAHAKQRPCKHKVELKETRWNWTSTFYGKEQREQWLVDRELESKEAAASWCQCRIINYAFRKRKGCKVRRKREFCNAGSLVRDKHFLVLNTDRNVAAVN